MVTEHSRVEDSKKLSEKNARLNLEVGSLINKNRAARMHGEAAAEKIRMFAHQVGEVVAKVELFDEKVGIRSKPSGTRIALILTNYSEKLERVLGDMKEVVNQVTDLRRQPERQDLAASSSKGVPNLSKLSLPGRDHDFRVQGRIRIQSRRLSDTGSPPKTWNAGYKPRSGDYRVCHT
jgi:hypothetical protein